jgi:hypothetical protein
MTPELVNRSTTDELWEMFKSTLLDSIDKHIPSKMTSARFTLPWVNRDIRKLIRKKQRRYNKAKRTNNWKDKENFRDCRRKIDRAIRKEYRRYVSDVIGGSLESNNTKPFWKFIKAKKQHTFGIAPLNSGSGKVATSPVEKAETLNNQFKSVFTVENTRSLPPLRNSNTPTINNIQVDVEGVLKLLSSVKVNKATGPDQIPARILKECSSAIAPIFTKIFQKSLDTGTLPKDWREAFITPIYKKGDKANPANYRPVSLTSIPSKLLEHIIHHHIMNHLDQFNLLSDHQHGFRKARSCESQLALTIDDLARSLNSQGQTDMVIMDFSKAFDTVPHQRLLHKLSHMGIKGSLHTWINNFLTSRYQQVVLEGSCSSKVPVTSGVPQGTVLGPLLFLIYINDLPSSVKSHVRLFADDCILYRQIRSDNDSVILQKDINVLCKWETDWQMSFNYSKCFVMNITQKRTPRSCQYTMGENVLEVVKHHPYLGVEISHDLEWKQHISKVTSKASSILGLLQRHLYDCSAHVKETAYMSLVRPRLEYCANIWDPHTKSDKSSLDRIQRKAARFVTRTYKRDASVTELLNKLGWQSLEERRAMSRLTFFYKAINKQIAFQDDKLPKTSTRTTRNSTPDASFIKFQTKKDCFKFSLVPRTTPEWNLIPAPIKDSKTVDGFKTAISKLDITDLLRRAHPLN